MVKLLFNVTEEVLGHGFEHFERVGDFVEGQQSAIVHVYLIECHPFAFALHVFMSTEFVLFFTVVHPGVIDFEVYEKHTHLDKSLD